MTLIFSSCSGENAIKLDQEMSVALRSLPYDPNQFSSINIYETSNSSFLSSTSIANLKPIVVLGTQSEIDEFLRIMSEGRTMSNDPTLKDFHYRPICYHIVAFNLKLDSYGYLKCMISSDVGKPVVARLQMPDGTNSFEYRKLLPMFIEEAIKRNLQKLNGANPR
jgi:hypothetical protein